MLYLDGISKRDITARSARFSIPYSSLGFILCATEASVVLAASVLTGASYSALVNNSGGQLGDYIGVGALVALLYCAVLKSHCLYKPAEFLNSRSGFIQLLWIWGEIFSAAAAIAFTLKAGSHFSRGAVLSFFIVGFPVVFASRRLLVRAIGQAIDSRGVTGRRLAVIFEANEIGDGSVLDDLRRHGYDVMRSFPILPGQAPAQAANQLTAYAHQMEIDEVLVIVSWRRSRAEIDQIVTGLRRIAAPVRLLADRDMRPLLSGQTIDLGRTLAVELRRAPLSRFEQRLKRSLDVILAGTALIVLAPLLLTVALLISLDSPGPVIFRQKRIGFNGRPFMIIKFRTMFVLEDGPVVKQAAFNDPRVTRVGRWLRRSSIDELPQLFNVFRGEMSLVGPRPHAECHDNSFEAAVADYALRQHVRPGLTGWAQINGCRGETPDTESIRRRVEYDLWYIDNWSLWLELCILSQTLPVLIGKRNAY